MTAVQAYALASINRLDRPSESVPSKPDQQYVIVSTSNLRRSWEDLGDLDPLWAMTGDHKLGRWELGEFLATGEAQVAEVMDMLHHLGRPAGRRAILDFGCGVGRLTTGFSRRFESYIGIDISESLIVQARELHQSLSNCRFEVGPEKLGMLSDAQFDLIYSFGVLFHIPDRQLVETYIAEFLRCMKPDGLLVFDIHTNIRAAFRSQPRRRLYHALRKAGLSRELLYTRLRLYPQGRYSIREDVMVAFLKSRNGQIVAIREDSRHDSVHQTKTFYVTR